MVRHTTRGKRLRKRRQSRKQRGGNTGQFALCTGLETPFKTLACIRNAKSNPKPTELDSAIQYDILSFLAMKNSTANSNLLKTFEADLKVVIPTIKESTSLADYKAHMQPIYKKYNIQPLSVKANNTRNSILRDLAKLNPNNANYITKMNAIRARLNKAKGVE
jgi:hypothetical protein